MVFWRKNSEGNIEEIEKIKERVGGGGMPEPPTMPVKKEVEPVEEDIELVPKKKSIFKPAPSHVTEKSEFAPLFVKIDRYEEVINKLGGIKKSLFSLKDLLELMTQVDDIKREGMSMLKKSLSSLTDTLISLDEEFVRPEGAEKLVRETKTPEDSMRTYILDLQSELKGLRKELGKIE